MLSFLPLEGYRWKVKEVYTYGKDREGLLCFQFEATVRLVKSKRNKN
jgi:hypothetical protein